MFQDRCYERDVDINNNFFADNMTNNMDNNYNVNNETMDYQGNNGINNAPVIEPMQEKCINRTIVHEVNHICPIRTKIINHHVYRHTYRPEYSCCEENVVSNVDNGSCSCFK